jgi:NAD+ diphosphatase
VLVTHGDSVLLGRQPDWPAGRYSTIAGFVEPGESLEDAVRREVFEETGIETGPMSYHSSQPWPFPRSLMLGFRAEARTTGVKLGDAELEDARWFSREEIGTGTMLPFTQSIAYRLIEDWHDAGAGRPLAETAPRTQRRR